MNPQPTPDAARESLLADLKPLMTIPEAAQVLRVSTRTVHRLLASRQLKASRVGQRVLIARTSLVRFLDHSPY